MFIQKLRKFDDFVFLYKISLQFAKFCQNLNFFSEQNFKNCHYKMWIFEWKLQFLILIALLIHLSVEQR